jgi:hypothetical protein
MEGMFVGFWTPVMQSRQAAFGGMQRTVGVMKQWQQLMEPRIWMVLVSSWQRQSYGMAPLQPSFNVLREKER